LRLAGQHGFQRIDAGTGFQQAHVQAGLAVVALLQSGVIAGELKGVAPLELKVDGLQRLGRFAGLGQRADAEEAVAH
jgi:hypothetical protein